MTQISQTTVRLYNRFRQHQRDIQIGGGGTMSVYPTGRVEMSYGSAPYGEHAVSAFSAAKRHAAWLARHGRAA